MSLTWLAKDTRGFGEEGCRGGSSAETGRLCRPVFLCSELCQREPNEHLHSGRPSYISDPAINTARGWIIYAHGVATNRVFSPQGKANPRVSCHHPTSTCGGVLGDSWEARPPVSRNYLLSNPNASFRRAQ